MFVFNKKRIISENNTAIAKVTSVKTCWWIKINTKPIRTNTMDGAVFPHIIYFTYSVDNVEYNGRKFINYNLRCPNVDEEIIIFYDKNNPGKCLIA